MSNGLNGGNINSLTDFDFVLDFCVICLVKAHHYLIYKCKYKEKEHKVQQTSVLDVLR